MSAEVQELRDGRRSFGQRGSGWPFLVLDDVEEGAPVELHVGEVLEEDVDGVDICAATLCALAGTPFPLR